MASPRTDVIAAWEMFICNTVENLCTGLEVEGIYRVSGMKSKVEALKESYEQGMW